MERANRGFTLIEVMIVVVVVAILASIAVPSYTQHIRRAAVEDALADLSTGRVAMEQYFLDNRTYTGTVPCPVPRSGSKFTYNCDTPARTDTTYTITATGSGTVQGFTYTINQANVRTTQSPWNTGTATCWIDRSGGVC
ncbi:MAG: prepilin-type N-terminal cleavage/methylation domain-containing protein [Nevskiaceae bacterium]|jgi:type IV pilus assembly protein PilE|nr:prepilin-type N-terminal cleavage/methylation domain-containing protein [Nevskiaceae bacterium]